MKVMNLLALIVAFAFPLQVAAQAAKPCNPDGNVQFICGQDAPEHLILIPASEWVLASPYPQNGGIRLINVRHKTATVAYPTATSKDRLDLKTYDSCPGPPDAAEK